MTTVTIETPPSEGEANLSTEVTAEQLAANAAENAVVAARSAIALAEIQAAETVAEVKSDIDNLEHNEQWTREQITALTGAVAMLATELQSIRETLASASNPQTSEEVEPEPVEVIAEEPPSESVEADPLEAETVSESPPEDVPLVVLV